MCVCVCVWGRRCLCCGGGAGWLTFQQLKKFDAGCWGFSDVAEFQAPATSARHLAKLALASRDIPKSFTRQSLRDKSLCKTPDFQLTLRSTLCSPPLSLSRTQKSVSRASHTEVKIESALQAAGETDGGAAASAAFDLWLNDCLRFPSHSAAEQRTTILGSVQGCRMASRYSQSVPRASELLTTCDFYLQVVLCPYLHTGVTSLPAQR